MLTPLENLPRGGADTWDDGNAGALLTAEAFGGAPEYFSGGASASVTVAAAGSGIATEQASGGASAAVEVNSAGAGIALELATGGASAGVEVTAAGGGTALERADGGASAAVAVTAAGDGTQTEEPSLNPRQTVVFSLQRTGAGDVVFSYQFPVSVSAVVEAAPSTWGPWPDIRDRVPRGKSQRQLELEAAEAERQARAAEVSEAAIARASQVASPAPESLAEVMQVWVMPASLSALIAEPVAEIRYPMDSTGIAAESVGQQIAPSPDMDEDAILAATVLLMRRRLTR